MLYCLSFWETRCNNKLVGVNEQSDAFRRRGKDHEPADTTWS